MQSSDKSTIIAADSTLHNIFSCVVHELSRFAFILFVAAKMSKLSEYTHTHTHTCQTQMNTLNDWESGRHEHNFVYRFHPENIMKQLIIRSEAKKKRTIY